MDAPAAWAPPAPRDMPDLRTRIMDYLLTPAMHASVVQALSEGRGAVSPRTGDLHRDASILIDEEHQRLDAAEL